VSERSGEHLKKYETVDTLYASLLRTLVGALNAKSPDRGPFVAR
jgi:hypothetical protein